MEKLNQSDLKSYVENNIGDFHLKRIRSLEKLKLDQILKRKNPYLFKAKNILTSQEIVKALVDAYLSSSEEGLFGEFLEGLAVYICRETLNGWKSGIEGIDLEFDDKNIRYIISIKSGPNWGNSSQVQKMITSFNKAIRTLRTNNPSMNIIPVNGCCYGRDNNPDKKGQYFKYCRQRFWHFISGDERLYIDLIEPLGHKAKEKNEEFYKMYSQMINKFTYEFTEKFCEDGLIDWEKLVKFNSSIKPIKLK